MAEVDFKERLGTRLRAIRNQQGMTLSDVEEASDGEWKAVAVGSYERGDRAISISKLSRLAAFYGVPVHELVPDPEAGAGTEPQPPADDAIVLDLTQLPEAPGDGGALPALVRFARHIQVERRDYNGTVLTIRSQDLRALALAFGQRPDELRDTLSARGAIRS